MAGRGQRSQLGQGNHSRRRVLERGRMERSNVEEWSGKMERSLFGGEPSGGVWRLSCAFWWPCRCGNDKIDAEVKTESTQMLKCIAS